MKLQADVTRREARDAAAAELSSIRSAAMIPASHAVGAYALAGRMLTSDHVRLLSFQTALELFRQRRTGVNEIPVHSLRASVLMLGWAHLGGNLAHTEQMLEDFIGSISNSEDFSKRMPFCLARLQSAQTEAGELYRIMWERVEPAERESLPTPTELKAHHAVFSADDDESLQ